MGRGGSRPLCVVSVLSHVWHPDSVLSAHVPSQCLVNNVAFPGEGQQGRIYGSETIYGSEMEGLKNS